MAKNKYSKHDISLRRCLLLVTAMMLMGCMSAAANEFADEQLSYKVTYKWGLIHKHAGNISILLRNTNGKYVSELSGRTISWADKFYRVRDTLRSVVHIDGFRPESYELIAHEGKDYKHDVIQYSHAGDQVLGHCTRYKTSDGKVKRDEQRQLETTGVTVDMLSALYYMRQLPYGTWQPGHSVTVNIFSGKRKELLNIKYQGICTTEVEDSKYTCYRIAFTFTSDGKKKTSDDIMAWIDTDTLVPVRIEGKLPLGSVRCYLTEVKH